MSCSPKTWDYFHKSCALAFILATFIVVIVTQVNVGRRENIIRYCFDVFSPQEGRVKGCVTLDLSVNSINYDMILNASISGITAFRIRGPFEPGNLATAPIATSLCGAPSPAPACDTITEPGRLKGSITLIYDGIPSSPLHDVRPLINDIRSHPNLYELELLTNLYPDPPGPPGFAPINFDAYSGYDL